METDLGRACRGGEEIAPLAQTELWQKLEKRGYADPSRIRGRKDDWEVEANQRAASAPQRGSNWVRGGFRGRDEIAAIAKPRLRGPALGRRAAPVGVDHPLRKHQASHSTPAWRPEQRTLGAVVDPPPPTNDRRQPRGLNSCEPGRHRTNRSQSRRRTASGQRPVRSTEQPCENFPSANRSALVRSAWAPTTPTSGFRRLASAPARVRSSRRTCSGRRSRASLRSTG